jgi:hypothetical protein
VDILFYDVVRCDDRGSCERRGFGWVGHCEMWCTRTRRGFCDKFSEKKNKEISSELQGISNGLGFILSRNRRIKTQKLAKSYRFLTAKNHSDLGG